MEILDLSILTEIINILEGLNIRSEIKGERSSELKDQPIEIIQLFVHKGKNMEKN